MLKNLYHNKNIQRIIPNLVSVLTKELSNCESVLDIGCGNHSPLQYVKNIKYSIGVEPFLPYLEESKRKKIHSEYQNKNLNEIDFKAKSFDAVILLEVIEHLTLEEGLKILEKASRIARKKVIISTPNGFFPQSEVDENPLQKHLSGWTINEFRELGFKCYGLAGLKCLREPVEKKSMDDDILVTVRFKPKIIWFALIVLSQTITYFIPRLSFSLFAVRKLSSF